MRRPARPHHDHEEHNELQKIGALLKGICFFVGMTVLAPMALNKIAKAVDSDVFHSFDFYRIARGK